MSAVSSDISVAPDSTHHVADGRPLYDVRFDEVLAFHSPGLASVRDSTGAYHISTDGTPRYARRFARTFGFYEGRAAVEDGTGAHHIDTDGADVGATRFAWCGNFQGGLCAVRGRDGRYFHVTAEDAPAYGERWCYVGDFREGLAVVQDDAGLHHHIDVAGDPAGTGAFVDLDVFHKGFARARDPDGWFHLRRDGCPAYGKRFAAVEPFYNGQARCETVDGAIVVVDESGEVRSQPRAAQRPALQMAHRVGADAYGVGRFQEGHGRSAK